MGQEPEMEELRLGARIYSVAAALAGVGYVFAREPWKYLLAAIAVVCFVRSILYFRKVKGLESPDNTEGTEAQRHGEEKK